MAIPTYQAFYRPLLELCKDGKEVKLSEAVSSLSESMGFSEEEKKQKIRSGNQTLLANRIGWAKTYLVKARLLKIPKRGYCAITERGLADLNHASGEIDDNYLSKYSEFVEFKTGKPLPPDVKPDRQSIESQEEELTPLESIYKARDTINGQLKSELLDRILHEKPDFFERLIVQLFVAMGYGGSIESAGKALEHSGDGGVDGVINQDVLGLDCIYLQAKRYEPDNSIGANKIRDFFGALDGVKASKGIFVTTSSFTPQAKETAKTLSKRIILIDGDTLTDLMLRYGVGCRLEENISIMRIDEDFFDTI